jgi:hypothetical protein
LSHQSYKSYNAAAGLCVICPITSRMQGYPFGTVLPDDAGFRGVVLADQPRSISWKKRPIEHPGEHLTECLRGARTVGCVARNRLNFRVKNRSQEVEREPKNGF